jgi:hypothetical protein
MVNDGKYCVGGGNYWGDDFEFCGVGNNAEQNRPRMARILQICTDFIIFNQYKSV